MTTHYVDVPEQGQWVDRTLATASWHDTYIIHPGTYPLEFTTINYRPVPEGGRPYYARARVKATLIEQYRVNRLLTASTAHTDNTRKDTEVIVTIYAYECKDGTRVLNDCRGGSLGTVRSIPDPTY